MSEYIPELVCAIPPRGVVNVSQTVDATVSSVCNKTKISAVSEYVPHGVTKVASYWYNPFVVHPLAYISGVVSNNIGIPVTSDHCNPATLDDVGKVTPAFKVFGSCVKIAEVLTQLVVLLTSAP